MFKDFSNSPKSQPPPTKEFIFVVLMCGWLSYVKLQDGTRWTVVDLFCGKAYISRLAAKLGFHTASVDINVPGTTPKKTNRIGRRLKRGRAFPGPKRNLMDINGHCGFPFRGGKQGEHCFDVVLQQVCPKVQPLCPIFRFHHFTLHEQFGFGPLSNLLRLIVILFLQSSFGKVLCFCGIVCSTWIGINLGTSKRSVLVPGGDETSVATRKGNIMCARTRV